MELGPVSLIDCVVFVAFLAPQLLLRAGFFATAIVALDALPFLLLKLPIELVKQRYCTSPASQPAFIEGSTLFEDLVVRCVRYAFSSVPANVGRIFFSKWVALPFLRWRMLRHGYLRCPAYWRDYAHTERGESFRGIWIMQSPDQPPDVVIYYVHGGGFAMGSCYFYLEFLLAWHNLLLKTGYHNPAVFALEYTLVPDGIYPKQVHEALQGYKHVLNVAMDASKVCIAGDSAGGALVLSLLQELGAQGIDQKRRAAEPDVRGVADPRPPTLALPGMATLISPWITLMTNLHYPSRVDYLNRRTLWKYAHEYAGESMINQHPASPGSCLDDNLWRASSPERGYFVTYGEEEVLAPDIESFLERQERNGLEIRGEMTEGGIHAWPVASLFLSSTEPRRLHGLRCIVNEMMRRSGRKDGSA